MSKYELEARYDSRKSFYHKAIVETWGGWNQNESLYSYETLVAQAGYIGSDVTGNDEEQYGIILLSAWDYSPTTLRHVKEFMRQHGFDAMSKAEIIKNAIEFDDYLVIIR